MEMHLDLLQNLEFAIVKTYREDPSLLDFDAKEAVEALIRYYRAEEDERTPPALSLSARAQAVFDAVKEVCEWRRGRAPLEGELAISAPTPVEDLVSSLRKINKSIPKWTEQLGRQGYLKFVSEYV